MPDKPPHTLADIATAFNGQVALNRRGLDRFHEALGALSRLAGQAQEAGLDRVGFQLAGYNTLRDINLVDDVTAKNPPPYLFGILTIYDARILVRIGVDSVVDCHADNLNKPRSTPQPLSDPSFWAEEKAPFRYFLYKEEDIQALLGMIIEAAATCAARDELKAFDRPPAAENPPYQGKIARLKRGMP